MSSISDAFAAAASMPASAVFVTDPVSYLNQGGGSFNFDCELCASPIPGSGSSDDWEDSDPSPRDDLASGYRSPRWLPASPQYAPSTDGSGPVLLPPFHSQSSGLASIPAPVPVPIPPITVARLPASTDSLSSTCQICANWFEPNVCLAHRCSGNCTSVICGTCLAQLESNKCIQRCGVDSKYIGTPDERLTQELFAKDLAAHLKDAKAENEDLKQDKRELIRMIDEYSRISQRQSQLMLSKDKYIDSVVTRALNAQKQLEEVTKTKIECDEKVKRYEKDIWNLEKLLKGKDCDTATIANERARRYENEVQNMGDLLEELMAEKEKELKELADENARLRSEAKSVKSDRKRKREETEQVPESLEKSIETITSSGGSVQFHPRRCMPKVIDLVDD